MASAINAIIGGRVQVRKVGGMWFVKVRYFGPHKVCVSFCLTTK
jgi:hypothetical protein